MSEKKKGTLVHDAVILFAITLIAALALGFVYEITKEPIAAAQTQAKIDAYKEVFPEMSSTKEAGAAVLSEAQALVSADAAYEGVTVDEVLEACDASGSCIGYVMTLTSSKGYGGSITMAMGVKSDGTMQGIQFLSISETAGLGMKAKDEEFRSQFRGAKVGQFSLTKKKIAGDTEVDAISSATITSTAVTRMVNAGLRIAKEVQD